jgi:hypothetical protein
MTWDLDVAACQSVAIIRCLYQGCGLLGGAHWTQTVDDLGRCVKCEAMARRIGQLVFALIPCGVVWANTLVDEVLKPCGEAYYYPSKVHNS